VWQSIEEGYEDRIRNLGASCIVVVEKEAIMARLVETNFHLR
jgi:DNA topoisomerase VI subunit A